MKKVFMVQLINKPINAKSVSIQFICANSKEEAKQLCTLKQNYVITQMSTTDINVNDSILYETSNF